MTCLGSRNSQCEHYEGDKYDGKDNAHTDFFSHLIQEAEENNKQLRSQNPRFVTLR